MARCVYFSGCGSDASVYFKGRMFCLEHAEDVLAKIQRVISEKEKRENRVIPNDEEIAINNPRYLKTDRGIVPIRGTRLVVTKNELRTTLPNRKDGTAASGETSRSTPLAPSHIMVNSS